jgi:NADPH-dependent 2,4-dienoyl-CoA reductase/sulfur reductase-like enzyme
MPAAMDNSAFLPVRQQYTQNLIEDYQGLLLRNILNQLPYFLKFFEDLETSESLTSNLHLSSSSSFPKVCIIGAGAAGLYAGMIFDTLGIDYDILEAQPNHIGGRLLTYTFEEGGPNDYFVRANNICLGH